MADRELSPQVCTGLSLEMQQFANGKVNGDLQTVLYQLYLPATAICSWLYLKTELSLWNWGGGLFVFLGILLVAEPWSKAAGESFHKQIPVNISLHKCCMLLVPCISGNDWVLLVKRHTFAGAVSFGVWPLVYGLSTVPLGMACVLQEQLFEACPTVSVLKMSSWSTSGMLTQGGQGGCPSPLARWFYRILTHIPLNLNGI
jgi:hypothetical protein